MTNDPRRRVLVTPLGTGNYGPASYVVDGVVREKTPYVQRAIAEAMVANSRRSKQHTTTCAIILATVDATAKHGDELVQSLNAIDMQAELVTIPKLASGEDYLALRTALRANLQPDDTVVVDITHGFRATAPLLLAALDEMLSEGAIKAVERVTYGLYEPNEPGPFAVWDISHALRTRRLVAALQAFVNHGYLIALANEAATFEAGRGSNLQSACQSWQRYFDTHRLDALLAASKAVVAQLDRWLRRLDTDPMAQLARSSVEAARDRLKPLADAMSHENEVEREARGFAAAAVFALDVGRSPTATLFGREAAISAFRWASQHHWPDLAAVEAEDIKYLNSQIVRCWERAFAMASASDPKADTDDPLSVAILDRINESPKATRARTHPTSIAHALQAFNNELRNPVAHCFRGWSGEEKNLSSTLRKSLKKLNQIVNQLANDARAQSPRRDDRQ